jgi:EAL domain-containing protein (putative c-di-GMP-specific phosphodiesterase class I)/sensor domain CHASE-containing protein
MTVRNTTILILSLTLAGLMVILYLSSRHILLGSFQRLEQAQVQRNVQRVNDALHNEMDILTRLANDWAQWDDMYAFARSRDPEFVRSNLVPSTFTVLHLTTFAVLDTQRQVMYEGMYDAARGTIVPLPAHFHAFARTSPLLQVMRQPDDGFTGIITFPDGLWLIAAQPILTSDGDGPARGTLLISRRIDASLIAHLKTLTQLSLSLFAEADRALPADCRAALSRLTGATTWLAVPLDARQIAGYTRLHGVDARSTVLARIEQPRRIYQQGVASIRYFLLWLLVAGLIVGLVTIYLLEATVLRRVTRLLQRVDEIGSAGDLALRVDLPGQDELASLGASMNGMLEALENAQQDDVQREEALRASEERFRYLFAVEPDALIAIAPDDGITVDALMRHADLAMYRAKEQGRNRCQFFTADMSAVLSERRLLEGQLRRALDNGEFTVLYQPQVDVLSRRIFGVEVLIRWQHPDRGTVSPLHFIPVAEETGLIEPIGEWVLRTACAQTQAWHQAGMTDLRVAVNLSARQFERQTLAANIERVLAETGLAPEALELEITESTAMRDWRRTATVLRQLRDFGIQIAIDDFGTGHCSFGYLQRFPVTTLKMDRTFIQELLAGPTNPAIVHAIVVLGQALGLTLIAECVETHDQLRMLCEQGCNRFQGYYFSKPLPAAECERLMMAGPILLPADIAARFPLVAGAVE